MTDIKLGPAGSPGKSMIEGMQMVKDMGLCAMEVEFVRGVKMGNDLAKQCGELAKELGIDLSVHAPYYINLASEDKQKRTDSVRRIMESAERGHYLGANNIVFHPAYFGKYGKEQVHEIVRDAVTEMMEKIKANGWDVSLAPETTGKHSAYGSLEETVKLAKETKCGFNIDFAHLYARNAGKIDYSAVLNLIQKELSPRHLQIHFSNISYTLKGERNHEVLNGHPPFKPLAEELLKRKLDATIICESPITWKDALKMKEIFFGLGHKFSY